MVQVTEADTSPAGTVIEPGPPQAELVDVKDAVSPPAAAGEPRASVQVVVFPPVTVEGENESEPSFAPVTVKVALALLVPMLPLIKAVVVWVTGLVFMVNVAVVLPLGTETLSGTEAAALDEDSETTCPLPPAFAEIVTVPLLVFPPATEAGETETLLTVWALAKPTHAATRLTATRNRRREGK